MKIKKLLWLGALGNLLCWIGDVLLSVFPGAVSGLKVDPVWAGAPLWRFSTSAILGSIAMMMVLTGFYGIYLILKKNAPKLAAVFFSGAMMGCIPGAVFHCICTTAAWFYDRMGGTAEAGEIVMEFFLEHVLIMALCSLGLILSSVILWILLVMGKTMYPKWSAVFNIMTMLVIGGILKPIAVIPGVMNLGGLLMFTGLAIVGIRKNIIE